MWHGPRTGYDLALSFRAAEGCAEIWGLIRSLQERAGEATSGTHETRVVCYDSGRGLTVGTESDTGNGQGDGKGPARIAESDQAAAAAVAEAARAAAEAAAAAAAAEAAAAAAAEEAAAAAEVAVG